MSCEPLYQRPRQPRRPGSSLVDKIDTGAQTAMWGGTGASFVIFGLNLSEWAALVSAIVAVLGLLVHMWSVWHKNRREEELHKLKVLELRAAQEDARGV